VSVAGVRHIDGHASDCCGVHDIFCTLAQFAADPGHPDCQHFPCPVLHKPLETAGSQVSITLAQVILSLYVRTLNSAFCEVSASPEEDMPRAPSAFARRTEKENFVGFFVGL
jgi:hypothetical protein